MAIIDRVRVRLPEETNIDLLNELITTAEDRINLRLGSEKLPCIFNSICVEVVIKMYRRLYYEGIKTEGADTINTSFMEDILNEYNAEFNKFIENEEKEKMKDKRKVRFI